MTSTVCSVLIPTFNRSETVQSCLEHLALQTVGPERLEVIVVDDGSTDGTVQLLRGRAWPFSRTVIHRQANAGPAAARNRGLADVEGPLVLFINDDALVAADSVERHLEVHRRHPRSMVLGTFDFVPSFARTPLGRILETTPHLFAYPLLEDGDTAVADLGATCHLSVSAGAAKDVGFDERFSFAAEDVDFALGLQDRGHTLRYAAGARALHDHHLTIEGIERMVLLRGVGAARLALKRGIPEGMLGDVRLVLTDVDGARRAVAVASDLLRRELDDAHEAEVFSADCYAALDTVFRLGNLLGYLDEPALVRQATELVVR